MVSAMDPHDIFSDFWTRAAIIYLMKFPNCTYEAEWTPFHYFSENLVAQGIEPGPLVLKPGTLTA
jgi:hypothetical protein